MQQRLQELKQDFELGMQQLAQLDQKRAELREKLLRISGAIQVLEELTRTPAESGQGAA
jgi:prefoldin subunit 5